MFNKSLVLVGLCVIGIGTSPLVVHAGDIKDDLYCVNVYQEEDSEINVYDSGVKKKIAKFPTIGIQTKMVSAGEAVVDTIVTEDSKSTSDDKATPTYNIDDAVIEDKKLRYKAGDIIDGDKVLRACGVPDGIGICNSANRTYMSYTAVTDVSSNQYRLLNNSDAYTDHDSGLRMYRGRLCIAVGSYYALDIGTKIDIVMENGSIVKCVLGDCKSDKHTDPTHRYQKYDGSVVEVVTDMAYFRGTWQYPDSIRGKVKEILIVGNKDEDLINYEPRIDVPSINTSQEVKSLDNPINEDLKETECNESEKNITKKGKKDTSEKKNTKTSKKDKGDSKNDIKKPKNSDEIDIIDESADKDFNEEQVLIEEPQEDKEVVTDSTIESDVVTDSTIENEVISDTEQESGVVTDSTIENEAVSDSVVNEETPESTVTNIVSDTAIGTSEIDIGSIHNVSGTAVDMLGTDIQTINNVSGSSLQ